MKRRAFLSLTAAAGSAAVTAPSWVQRAFAQDGTDDRDPAADLAALSEAYRAAQRSGRPLLVFVIPGDDGRRWERGHAFGEVLQHGGPEVMADLALAEVACATMESVRRLVPQVGAGEPLMVVVEPERHPAVARSLDEPLPTAPSRWAFEGGYDEYDRVSEAAIDARIALLTRLVHEGLAADGAAVARRAAVAQRRVGADVAARVRAAARAGDIPAQLAEWAPALLLAAAPPARRAQVRDALAAAAIARLREQPTRGSRWAIATGCGITVEGAENQGLLMACGMGHVPARSQRFLYWYTR